MPVAAHRPPADLQSAPNTLTEESPLRMAGLYSPAPRLFPQPRRECSTLTTPAFPVFLAVPWLIISPTYFRIGRRESKAYSQSFMQSKEEHLQSFVWRKIPPRPWLMTTKFGQGRREGREKPYGLLALAFSFWSPNCKMRNSYTRFVPFTIKEGAGTDLFI